MVCPIHIRLRVGHKAKYAPGRIADARDVVHGSIWIGGEFAPRGRAVRMHVPLCYLAIRAQAFEHGIILWDKFPFAMPHRQFELADALEPHAARGGIGLQAYPPVLETSGIIVRERRFLAEFAVEHRQHAHLDEHLKTVADADGQLARSHKLFERLAQAVTEAVGEYFAGRHIISKGKSTRNRENMIFRQKRGLLDEVIQMKPLRIRARARKRELCFPVAIDAKTREDECSYVQCPSPARRLRVTFACLACIL